MKRMRVTKKQLKERDCFSFSSYCVLCFFFFFLFSYFISACTLPSDHEINLDQVKDNRIKVPLSRKPINRRKRLTESELLFVLTTSKGIKI